MKKTLLIVMALFWFSALVYADGFTIFATRAAQNPTDFIDWSQLGVSGTQLSTPQFLTTFNGNAALTGNVDGSSFVREDEGNGWTGNFDYGENLVWTGNNAKYGVAGEGPFAIVLANPVGSFGFSIQADMYGPFTAYVAAFDAAGNLLFSQAFNGVSTNLENGSALFVGLGDTSGVNIATIEFTTTSTDPSFNNDFAIDDPSFTYTTAAPVPEPSSMAFLLSALLGVGVIRRFKK